MVNKVVDAIKRNWVPSIGNFAIQYNFSSLSVALIFLTYMPFEDTLTPAHNNTQFLHEYVLYDEPKWAKLLLQVLVFVGALVGMLTMGYLGDIVGRRRALMITLALTVVGAAGSACATWGNPTAFYAVMSLFRLINGIGVGGIYPLTASKSSEAHAADQSQHGVSSKDASRVGWAFFWQSPGAASPYVIGLLFAGAYGFADRANGYAMEGDKASLDRMVQIVSRITLLVGAILATIALIGEWLGSESKEFVSHHVSLEQKVSVLKSESQARLQRQSLLEGYSETDQLHVVHPPVMRVDGPLRIITREPKILIRLIGTVGTWFLFDVAYYGVQIYLPTILKSIFAAATPFQFCWQALVVDAAGIPGSVAAVLSIAPLGGRWLNVIGFISNMLCFIGLGILYAVRPDDLEYVKFGLLCALMCSLNFGPNVATYVVPTTAFPTRVRSTCHGISAAGAKLGAVLGTFLFKAMTNGTGSSSFVRIMFLQSGVCFLGAVIAFFFLKGCDKPVKTSDEMDAETLAQAAHSVGMP